jgi:N-acetylmuramoyl-L-alanine amidase
MKKSYFNLIYLYIILLICILFSERGLVAIKQLQNSNSDKITVVLDAGHGGFDPGKIGINQALEKNINLSFTYKIKKLLEQNGINVILTRKDKNGLYSDSDIDKKRVDMKKRISIINSSKALIAVSIHQNSFSQESSWGAQVFYYSKSEKGKILAETLQETIKSTMKDGNNRLAKANSSYFLLLRSTCPTAIVECGFLTNHREANLLCTDAYQDKMSWAIYLGIMNYINNYEDTSGTPFVINHTKI